MTETYPRPVWRGLVARFENLRLVARSVAELAAKALAGDGRQCCADCEAGDREHAAVRSVTTPLLALLQNCPIHPLGEQAVPPIVRVSRAFALDRRHQVTIRPCKLSQEGSFMCVQLVMDRTGESRFEFDPSDEAAVAQALERFKALAELGYTAAERTGPGTSRKVTAFDPTAAEVLFMPRLVGG